MRRATLVSRLTWGILAGISGWYALANPADHSPLAPAPPHATATRPNLVLLLADDLGWSDLGCYGADLHETPRLDQFAREALRFSQAYAMPVCSPTRAALLTGKHAARLRFTVWREAALERQTGAVRAPRPLLPPPTLTDLPLEETTLAEVLQAAGYLTFHVGKWHLGDADHAPELHGFDVNIGGTHWGAPPTFFHPFRGPFGQARERRYVPGLGLGQPGEYLTDRLTDEALRLVDAAGDRPFFLNLWFHNPHTPIEGKPAHVTRFRERLTPAHRHQNPDYAAMVYSLDENVGRVLDHLERRGLAQRTVVVFASDNGGYVNEYRGRAVTTNFPLRSGKGSLYEGGIRVPLLIRWPGVTPPGTVCNEPVVVMDLFPTLAELAGAAAPLAPDGLRLLPLLRNPHARLPRDTLAFHFPHYYPTTTPASALRHGDWKLIEYYEGPRAELYHLGQDPGEQKDLALEQPRRVAELRARLAAWRREVNAQDPQPARPAAVP
jgi:arylsulfatase A-like enzyme